MIIIIITAWLYFMLVFYSFSKADELKIVPTLLLNDVTAMNDFFVINQSKVFNTAIH